MGVTPQTEAQMVAALEASIEAAPGLSAVQLDFRRGHIGGSEIAAILGEDEFAGPLDVYLAKVEGLVRPTTSDMLRGQFLEDGVRRWYAQEQGLRVLSTFEATGGSIRLDGTHAGCTPDALAVVDGGHRLVSIKCPRRAGDRWGPTGGSRVPVGYVLQLQWEHSILSEEWDSPLADLMHLVALVDGDLRVYPVLADREIQSWLRKYAEEWWARHVVAKVPPPLDGSDTAKAWLRRRFPRDTQPSRRATLDEELMLRALRSAEQTRDEAALEYARTRQFVEEAIADAGGLEGQTGLVTWRANKLGKRQFITRWTEE